MKLNIKKEKDNTLTFELKDASPAYANALRRTIMREVPVMAIKEVDIYENTSSLFPEYIAHRLGMIPLTTDLTAYVLPENCCGGNCSKCSTILTLDVEGPKTVYSKDLKPTDENVTPAYENIPIIKLIEGQRLRLEAKAVLGRSKDHARWQSCHVSYNTTNGKDYKFELESYGNLPAKKILEKAVKILETGVKEIKAKVK